MRRRFFVEGFDGAKAMLRGQSAAHLARVLRAEPDQLYELSDGQKVWLARVERAQRDAVEFALIEPVAAQEAPLRVQLLLAIVKFDRFEWCLEKATELGASEIVPLAAARSGKALIAAAAKHARRWEKILLESAQQARRVRPPALAPVANPHAAFAASSEQTRILLAESREAPPLRDVLSKLAISLAGEQQVAPADQSDAAPIPTETPPPEESQPRGSVWSFLAEGHGLDPSQERFNPREGNATHTDLPGGASAGAPKPAAKDSSRAEISAPETVFRRVTNVALAIGPEGGWTEDELALARAAGFDEASLGGNILRTETAVIASLAILNYALGY